MGITHWGCVKGMMWNQRPNGWLVDTHGKQRSAMTWLQDFVKSKQPKSSHEPTQSSRFSAETQPSQGRIAECRAEARSTKIWRHLNTGG